jgi:hypothetical protein
MADPAVFCALIGHRLTHQHDRAVHKPLQVLHVSVIVDNAIRHRNRDALDNAETASDCATLQQPNGNFTGHKPKTVRMTEQNNPPKSAGASDAAAGIPFYEKQRQHLKELIARKRALEKRLVQLPSSTYPN